MNWTCIQLIMMKSELKRKKNEIIERVQYAIMTIKMSD